ncbi:MAG: hypothetical protein VW935_06015, partial [Novosphingobium sp.]
MTHYSIHTIETAPEAAKPLLAAVKKGWGFIPKLQGTLAESALALEAYDTLFNLVAAKASLTPAEQQIV